MDATTQTLIHDARVYDRAFDIHKPPVRDVIVKGDRIASVSLSDELAEEKRAIKQAAAQGRSGTRVVDGRGMLLIPGLVNAHYHSYDVLSKGRFEDMPFDVWMLHSQPAYWGKRSRAELRARTLVGAMECLRHGITTLQDMNSLVPQDEETLDTILSAYAGTGVVHNPLSNLKLKNGVAPLLDLKGAGVNLALGCDNCSCSDCQNLFQAMKMFALLCAGMDGEPRGICASDAIDAATLGGAHALGLGGQIGEVRPGMKADLVLIDLSDFAYLPFNSAARQLVYCETGRGVHTVLVDGEVVVENGQLTTINEAEFHQEIADVMRTVDRDYTALVERQEPAISYLLQGNRALQAAPLGLRRFIGDLGH
jgi:cytosine/adenosine deaminase-related metal-dependent hydrolase